jgi:hypothetical protein
VSAGAEAPKAIRSTIPARLDRLSWSPFHTRMVAGLGVIVSGVLLAISGWMFDQGHLDATSQTFCWIVIFFFASAGASAAYLTVSETWPIEIRAEAIAVFFAIAQIFGAFGPVFYGSLIGTAEDRTGSSSATSSGERS